MAENVGCVCQYVPQAAPAARPASPNSPDVAPPPSASDVPAGALETPIAGMATVAAQQAAVAALMAQQQQQRQQQQRLK